MGTLRGKERLHVPNASHGTVNTKKMERNEIPRDFYVFTLLKMSLHVTICRAFNGSLEAESTK
jgi:hypothetical protein